MLSQDRNEPFQLINESQVVKLGSIKKYKIIESSAFVIAARAEL